MKKYMYYIVLLFIAAGISACDTIEDMTSAQAIKKIGTKQKTAGISYYRTKQKKPKLTKGAFKKALDAKATDLATSHKGKTVTHKNEQVVAEQNGYENVKKVITDKPQDEIVRKLMTHVRFSSLRKKSARVKYEMVRKLITPGRFDFKNEWARKAITKELHTRSSLWVRWNGTILTFSSYPYDDTDTLLWAISSNGECFKGWIALTGFKDKVELLHKALDAYHINAVEYDEYLNLLHENYDALHVNTCP